MRVTINNGYMMRAWYDVLSEDFVRVEDEETLRSSQALVEELMAREKAQGIPAERMVLAGFSQGGAMTLQTGLRHPEKLAGMLVLSSYLPLRDKAETERHASNKDTPIFMAHGVDDQIIAFERAQHARELLEAMGYPVEWHEYPMPHSLCGEEIEHIGAWFRRILK
jgi:phospholipase/carboxylesterase